MILLTSVELTKQNWFFESLLGLVGWMWLAGWTGLGLLAGWTGKLGWRAGWSGLAGLGGLADWAESLRPIRSVTFNAISDIFDKNTFIFAWALTRVQDFQGTAHNLCFAGPSNLFS